MTALADIGLGIDRADTSAAALLALAEATLEHWLIAHDKEPTRETREGFRLLALHRQGCQGDQSFNACRETCRELAYHYNLVEAETADAARARHLVMMRFVARHLFLFVSGKLEQAGLGEFCCAAKPLRMAE